MAGWLGGMTKSVKSGGIGQVRKKKIRKKKDDPNK